MSALIRECFTRYVDVARWSMSLSRLLQGGRSCEFELPSEFYLFFYFFQVLGNQTSIKVLLPGGRTIRDVERESLTFPDRVCLALSRSLYGVITQSRCDEIIVA